MQNKKLDINLDLVQKLIASQFSQWIDLKIKPVSVSGWDNKTFHLGETMSIRMPSSHKYELQVEKEHKYLPKLSKNLKYKISKPIAMGQPDFGYPLKWSIYEWIEGDTLLSSNDIDLCLLAQDLADFLNSFHKIDSNDGPVAGEHSFYRGGNISVYTDQAMEAFKILKNSINTSFAIKIWEIASKTEWQKPPVWVHGDFSPGNILVKNEKLCAIIDFGQLAIGDPACDLALVWTVLKGESRTVFKKLIDVDDDTWLRAKAWVLWKAAIVASGIIDAPILEKEKSLDLLCEILE